MSTVHKIFKTIVDRFVQQFGPEQVDRLPTDGKLATIMETYCKLGFPGALGSVDCTHVIWNKCPYSLGNLLQPWLQNMNNLATEMQTLCVKKLDEQEGKQASKRRKATAVFVSTTAKRIPAATKKIILFKYI